jgi:hypothetical protein
MGTIQLNRILFYFSSNKVDFAAQSLMPLTGDDPALATSTAVMDGYLTALANALTAATCFQAMLTKDANGFRTAQETITQADERIASGFVA